MPAHPALYQQVEEQIKLVTAPTHLRITSVRRLALLVTGIIAAQRCAPRPVAAELQALGLTRATCPESIERRLRRTLADDRLAAATSYGPAVRAAAAWPVSGARRVVLVVDESSQDERVHLLRVGLAYRGGSLPLAWTIWEQNAPLPAGEYWRRLTAVLAEVAALLPPNLEVVVVADRADDVPPFVDRVAAHGGHWIVRCKARGTLRFRDRWGRVRPLGEVVAAAVAAPGQRWKARGAVCKKAGWREASVVALWGRGQAEPLVVLSDRPPRWTVVREYERRFWIESGFRADKTKGWQGEASQIRGLGPQARRRLALAWASLVVLCLGAAEAARRVAGLTERARLGHRPGRPQHARDSLFTLGLRQARARLYRTTGGPFPWRLPRLAGVSWTAEWMHHQRALRLTQSVRP